MKTISIRPALFAAVMLTGMTSSAPAQYYYPPGYGFYYPQQQPQRPPQNGYPPRQQQHAPQEHTRQRAHKQEPDNSAAVPPDVDVSNITGPFRAYTWDFNDTFSDLAKATSVSTNQILALNNLSFSQLRDGQVLRIPTLESSPTLDLKPSRQQQLAREAWRGIRGKKRIALTFDAGGEPDGANTLIANLQRENAAATFFATGEFAIKHPGILKKIAAADFPIHNHSWSHPEFTKISDDEIRDELTRTDEAISSATGKSTKPYWRPPFGDRDNRVLQVAAEAGYKSIYWTLDSLDSVDEKKSADFVINRVLSPPRAKANPDGYLDGAIVLMHVGEQNTADAIPELIRSLRERGFTLVTVDEILNP